MTRLQDVALGGGLFVALVALVACAVQMVLEVLAVERDRREDAGRGQSAGARHAAAVTADAPPPGVVPPDDLFAETVRRVHWDIADGWDQ